MDWSCGTCTYLNEPAVQKCVMCKAERERTSTNVIDLTSPVASMESARKRKRINHPQAKVQSTLFGAVVKQTDSTRKQNKKSLDGNDNDEASSASSLSKQQKRSKVSATATRNRNEKSVKSNVNRNYSEKKFETNHDFMNSNKKKQVYEKSDTLTRMSTATNANTNSMISSSSSFASEKSNSKSVPIEATKQTSITSSLSPDQLYQKAMTILKQTFQLDSLRKLQPIAVRSVLEGKSQLIIMATGGGKSLCYQLPALVMQGLTIVISPLIALMTDQVNALQSKGIHADFISSAKTAAENKAVLDTLKQMAGLKKREAKVKVKKLKLLYVTPESMQTSRFQKVLKALNQAKQLSFLAIDEAHCLSTWGHDFRKAFLKLSWFRDEFPHLPVMALTATATDKVIQDIQKILKFGKNDLVHKSSFNRENIEYIVKYKDHMGDIEAMNDMISTIKKQHAKAQKNGAPCSGIVYVHKREDTMMISSQFQKAGIHSAPYHGAMKDGDRKRVQKDWTDGKIQVAIATVAFGMGIDLHCVRYVIHWNMSKSMESFYQESGRGGRDGLPAVSILYFSKSDANKFAFLIQKNIERKEENKQQRDGIPGSVDDRDMDALTKMTEYCTSKCCRRKYLLQHFAEKIDPKLVCKKTCDYCKDPSVMENALNSSSIQKAVRDTNRQRQTLSRKPFVGKSSGVDGMGFREDNDWDDDEFYYQDRYHSGTESGFGITSSFDTGFKTASGKSLDEKDYNSVFSKFEAIETKAGKASGFVTYKKAQGKSNFSFGKETKSTSVNIPLHLRKALSKSEARKSMPTNDANKAQPSSKELGSRAAQLKAELEEIRRRKI